MKSNRKKRFESQVGSFIQAYQRKAQKGKEPNDRSYDIKFEKIIKKLSPEELNELLHGEGKGEDENIA